MKYINEFREGDHISGIYLCKQKTSAITRNGKPYDNVLIQDKTGILDAKVWDPNSSGIMDFDAMDYINLQGEVISFSGNLQLNIRRVRVAEEGTYAANDYFPVTRYDQTQMLRDLQEMITTVENAYLRGILESFFVRDTAFIQAFKEHSAAQTVHHGFIGGLLEHTLGVARLCDYMARSYPLLKRDLLLTAALLHDIGKVRELSPFPLNDYTDEGQLIGHIVIGAQMVQERIAMWEDFPPILAQELLHCILSHHGELEYGSPKKPSIPEAVALNLADMTDAKMETLTELYEADHGRREWLGFNKLFDSNMRLTDVIIRHCYEHCKPLLPDG